MDIPCPASLATEIEPPGWAHNPVGYRKPEAYVGRILRLVPECGGEMELLLYAKRDGEPHWRFFTFRTYCYRMPKPQKNPTIPTPARKRVFGQRGKSPRVGLYARVSTHDQQTLPMQLSAMRSYARKRGWTVAVEVKDVGSGATTRLLREKLIETARRREIDSVIVWRLDRWGRSLVDLVNTLQELTALDVGFVSLSEALDLTTPSGRALAGMLAVRNSNGIFCGTG